MKHLLTVALLIISVSCFALGTDTILVSAKDLNTDRLQAGKFEYALFSKKTHESSPTRVILVTFAVEKLNFHGHTAFEVMQQWDADTTVHNCKTIFNAKGFETIIHETYWKRLGYTMAFDYELKKVTFTPANGKIIPDSNEAVIRRDFLKATESYNLNWHADMIIYSLLSYKEGRTFIINYFDPGFGGVEKVKYTVTGSEFLHDSHGGTIDCWMLNHFNEEGQPEKGYERFWISKTNNEVLKMEDYGGRGASFRYKIKLGISI